MQVSNKIIVVTGAGSGIGRELTVQLLKKQAKVAGVDINLNALLETQKIDNVGQDKFKAFELNITDKEKVEALPNDIISHFGSVDGIINNAGIIQHFIPVNDLGYDEINRVFNVNFFGTLYLTKAFLPHFYNDLKHTL
jgi:NADP-dependent 3-hydroxy acid dehydrogenase YdfG